MKKKLFQKSTVNIFERGGVILTIVLVLFVVVSFSGLTYLYLNKNNSENNFTKQKEFYGAGVRTDEVKVYHSEKKAVNQSSPADPKTYWGEIIDKGDIDAIKSYLEKGGDIEYVINDYNGQRPLMRAAALGKNDVVSILLDSGAKIEAVDKAGSAVLSYALAKGQTDTARLLIGHGANVNAFSKLDVTPLYEAASWGTPVDVRMLLDAGANIEGHGKRPPLYIAVLQGNADIVKLLIERGANVNAIDSLDSSNSTGMTPLEGARVTSNKEIETMLIVAGAKE